VTLTYRIPALLAWPSARELEQHVRVDAALLAAVQRNSTATAATAAIAAAGAKGGSSAAGVAASARLPLGDLLFDSAGGKPFPSLPRPTVSGAGSGVSSGLSLGGTAMTSSVPSLAAAGAASLSSVPASPFAPTFGQHEVVLIGQDLVPSVHGRLLCFSGGFVLTDCAFGPLVVRLSRDVLQAALLRGGDESFVEGGGSVFETFGGGGGTGGAANCGAVPRARPGDGLAVLELLDCPEFGLLNALRPHLGRGKLAAWAKSDYSLGLVLRRRTPFRQEFLTTIWPAWCKALDEEVGAEGLLLAPLPVEDHSFSVVCDVVAGDSARGH
jgi:hypothetical protein